MIQPASSEQNNATTFPISSGVPRRLIGVQPLLCQFLIEHAVFTPSRANRVDRNPALGLIELAIDWTLTETPYLGRDGHLPNPRLLHELYQGEFDGAYQEGTLFVLTLHPFVSGHRAPMQHSKWRAI